MLAILYGLMGLVFLPIMLLFALLGSQLPAQQRAGVMAVGVGFMLFFPVIYAAMGFVFGVIGAWIYNIVAKWVGGIEVEVE